MTKYDDAWVAREEAKRAMMAEKGLYDPQEEHSSCGVGLVVNIDGSKSRAVVENGIIRLHEAPGHGIELLPDVFDRDGVSRRRAA